MPPCCVALPLFLIFVVSRLDKTEGLLDIGVDYGRVDNLQRINYNVLQQIKEAELRTGNDSVVIKIPEGDASKNNWPFFENSYFNTVSRTLYKQGVIRKRMVGKEIIDKPIDQY